MARARGKSKVQKPWLCDSHKASGMRVNPYLRWRYHTKERYYSAWYEGVPEARLGTIWKLADRTYEVRHADSQTVIRGITTLQRALHVLQTIQQLGRF